MAINKPLLIVKLGATYRSISKKYGDFEDWIKSNLEIDQTIIETIAPFNERKLPDPEKYSGIILTGSHATIMNREEWSERSAAWIPVVIEKAIPLLGICYGHQLIAHAMGGKVDNNPRGKEFGTVEIKLLQTAKTDALFNIFPFKMLVHTGHSQSIVNLPPAAKVLASSLKDPYAAFFLPPCGWGVQFHPEYTEIILSGYVNEAVDLLRSDGQDPDVIMQNIQHAPESHKILKRFAELVIKKSKDFKKEIVTVQQFVA